MGPGLLARNPQFKKLWSAQVVSQAGDWLNRIATLQLLDLYGGGSTAVMGMGLLFAIEHTLRLLPAAVLGPIAGTVADRLPRQVVLVAGDLLRALLVLAFLIVDSSEDLPLLYALVLVQMGLASFFDAARQGLLPSSVRTGDLHSALALSAATWSAMLSIGSLLGGFLVAGFGTDTAFVVDAATYTLSAVLVATIRLPAQKKPPERLRLREFLVGRDLARGLVHVRELGITSALWAKFCWGGGGGLMVLLALAPRTRFGADEAESALAFSSAYGLLLATRGVGTAIGPYIARRWLGTGPHDLVRTIGIGFIVAPLGYAGFAMSTSLPWAAFWVMVAHIGGGAIWVASTSIWQQSVTDHFRGRVHTLDFLGMTISFSFFSLAAGLLYDTGLSIEVVTWCMCAAVVSMGLLWWLGASRLRRRAALENRFATRETS